jgi:hypothetical protein
MDFHLSQRHYHLNCEPPIIGASILHKTVDRKNDCKFNRRSNKVCFESSGSVRGGLWGGFCRGEKILFLAVLDGRWIKREFSRGY